MTGIAVVATLGLTTQPANAAWAYGEGEHSICADSVTQYNNGKIWTLTRGDTYFIDDLAYDGRHAWGWEIISYHPERHGPFGWVHNGWFC